MRAERKDQKGERVKREIREEHNIFMEVRGKGNFVRRSKKSKKMRSFQMEVLY